MFAEVVGGEWLFDLWLRADRLLQLDKLEALGHDAGADFGEGQRLVIIRATFVNQTLDQCDVLGVRLVHCDYFVFGAF